MGNIAIKLPESQAENDTAISFDSNRIQLSADEFFDLPFAERSAGAGYSSPVFTNCENVHVQEKS